jgi:hypothetical protein
MTAQRLQQSGSPLTRIRIESLTEKVHLRSSITLNHRALVRQDIPYPGPYPSYTEQTYAFYLQSRLHLHLSVERSCHLLASFSVQRTSTMDSEASIMLQ